MFRMRFDTDNAAFDDGGLNIEVAVILRKVASLIEAGGATGLYQNCVDSNGNVVGTFRLRSDDDKDE